MTVTCNSPRGVVTRHLSLVLALSLLLSLAGSVGGARGEAPPTTVARRLPVSLPSLVGAGDGALSLSGDGRRLTATASTETRPVTLCAPIDFTAVALAWRQEGQGGVEATIQTGHESSDLGSRMEAGSLLEDGPDLGSREYNPALEATDLLWVEKARCARFSLALPANVSLSDLELVVVNSSGSAHTSSPVSALGSFFSRLSTATPANAMTYRPKIVGRSGWGANESLRNCDPAYARALKMAFVHHTAGSNDYSESESDDIVRAIYWYHTQVLGWCDIAYNFLVDKYGQIFEGRAGGVKSPVVPAATQGFNTGSVAVSAIGNLELVPPSRKMLRATKRLLSWRLDIAHLPPRGWVTTISGGSSKYPEGTKVTMKLLSEHRRVSYTACPGAYLSSTIPKMRDDIDLMGRPKIYRPKRSRWAITPTVDTIRFTARATDKLKWNVEIVDPNGVIVRTLRDRGSELDVEWDGFVGPLPAEPGYYSAVVKGTRSDGKRARSARIVFKVKPLL